jgi:hypothetical protein
VARRAHRFVQLLCDQAFRRVAPVALQERQADDELTPSSESLAVRLDDAAVHLHQVFHERQPDSQTALGACGCVIDLHEKVENMRQHFGRYPDAVVFDSQHRPIAFTLCCELDQPLRLRVFRRVGEEVGIEGE